MKGVELLGFEPRQTEPKSVVLPLHHSSIRNGSAKIKVPLNSPKIFEEKNRSFLGTH